MRFTDAHTPDALCAPTRYAVATGKSARRLATCDPPDHTYAAAYAEAESLLAELGTQETRQPVLRLVERSHTKLLSQQDAH
jgi:arylsulfatase A-like enzyme